jgi:hypothetical protein
MREEFDRCNKPLPFSLASKLFSSPDSENKMEEENMFNREVEMVAGKRVRHTSLRDGSLEDLMFRIDL